MQVNIKRLHHEAIIPKYARPGDAGFDIHLLERTTVWPNQSVVLARTGLAFEIPDGYEMQIRQRSGLSRHYPNYIANTPATIDSGYRGEVYLMLVNHGSTPIVFDRNERIAQGVIKPVKQVQFVEVAELSTTERGEGAFGSTGSN
jgi:dUTP pyrophosphatase